MGTTVTRRGSIQVAPGQRFGGTVEEEHPLTRRSFLAVLGHHHPVFHLFARIQGRGEGRGGEGCVDDGTCFEKFYCYC